MNGANSDRIISLTKNYCIPFYFLCFVQLVSYGQTKCCCGTPKELLFPAFDFEISPFPASGGFDNYGLGSTIGQSPWVVNKGSIDYCDKDCYFSSSSGNPNGPSNFIDLWGWPNVGGGGMQYPLTGLTPGAMYLIEFYYAKFDIPGNFIAYIKIASGAWLNATWTATNPGNIIWLKASYNFTAQASSTLLEFGDAGSSSSYSSAVLIDDIRLFECPLDKEKPVVNNPPDDIIVDCDKDVPQVAQLNISDNCDPNSLVTLKVTKDIADPCNKKIVREWTIKDACDNITIQNQTIRVIDKTPPQFSKPPQNKITYCTNNFVKEFNDWIALNGNAVAKDDCGGTISWRVNYDHKPNMKCDFVYAEFIAADQCGNENSQFASFVVRDTLAPKFTVKAESKNFVCVPGTKDSLRNWLANYGFSKTLTDCDTVILSSNFDGDSTKNPLSLTFYSKDRCGNTDSCKATFSYRSNSDTFRISAFSCDFPQFSIDTFAYTVNGCDSIVIRQNIKLNGDSTYLQLNSCDVKQRRYDTLTLVNSKGCDSVIFKTYTLNLPVFTTFQKMDCAYKVYFQDTIQLHGQYCDSFVITQHIPLRKDSIVAIVKTCDAAKVDTIIQHLINNQGCDSLVTIYTIFTPQQITYIDKKTCGLGKPFSDTTEFTTGLCDSLVITNHIPLSLDTTKLFSTTCDPAKAGIFSQTYSNQSGCDSLVVQLIDLNPSDSTFISKSSCVLSQAGTTTLHLRNQYGCDSSIQTTTTFIPSDTIRTTKFTCTLSSTGTDTIVYMGKFCDSVEFRTTIFIPSDTNYITKTTCELNKEKKDTMLLKGSKCDSLVYINTIFIPSDTVYISHSSCDLLKVGIDTLVLKGSSCDSVVFIKTDFIPADTSHVFQSSCNPKDTGVQRTLLFNHNGCDSLIITNTKYNPLHLTIDLDSISCYNKNDGSIKINDTTQFSKPVNLILNSKDFGDLYQLNNLSKGSYQLYIRDQRGCVTDSIQFTLSNPDELIIELGNNLEVKKGASVDLNLQSNKSLQKVFWQPASLTNCSNCSNIQFIAEDNIWIYTQAIDDNNCTQTDSIFIQVKKPGSVFAPNVFSPNGDNINDLFYIHGDENALVELLFIYDRWGNKIFEKNNIQANMPTFGWDGSFRSEKMLPGVYLYYAKIKIGDEEIELKGDLTLIR